MFFRHALGHVKNIFTEDSIEQIRDRFVVARTSVQMAENKDSVTGKYIL